MLDWSLELKLKDRLEIVVEDLSIGVDDGGCGGFRAPEMWWVRIVGVLISDLILLMARGVFRGFERLD